MASANDISDHNIDDRNDTNISNNIPENISNDVPEDIVEEERDETPNQIRSKKTQSICRDKPLPKRAQITRSHMLVDSIVIIVKKMRESCKEKVITVWGLA